MRKIQLLALLIGTLLNFFAYAQDLPVLNRGIPGNKPGDIITPLNDSQIAAWCDFSKQIVVTRTNVLCVYSETNRVMRL